MICKNKMVSNLRTSICTLIRRHEPNRFSLILDDALSSDVCSCLEALFLHGLHSSSIGSMSKTLKNQSNFLSVQFSFWDVLKCLVPKHLVNGCINSGVHRTKVGCCRVWIRFCLNEASLHSYLTIIKDDAPRLSRFYTQNAILLDQPLLEEVIKLVETLEGLRFKLDLTSPLLNSWMTSKALQLLGLSRHFFKAVGDMSGGWIGNSDELDSELSLVDDSVTDDFHLSCKPTELKDELEDLQPLRTSHQVAHSPTIHSHVGQLTHGVTSTPPSSETCQNLPTFSSSFYRGISLPAGSNNLLRQAFLSWSEPLKINQPDSLNKTNISSEYTTESVSVEETNQTNKNDPIEFGAQSDISSENSGSRDESWYMVGEDLLLALTDEDVNRLVNLFPGSSDFYFGHGRNSAFHGNCVRCEKPLKQNSSFLDYYDAHFYCANCHQLQEAIIPRDVIMNWDFSLQPVSQPTRSFLQALYDKPVLNLTKLNPMLYAVVPKLLRIRQLRRMLVLLWHQIARCDAKAASDLNRSLQSRTYMLQSLFDLDIYSMSDLISVASGQLEEDLLHVIKDVALCHVYRCHACRRRALLCNLCERLSKPVWPHEFITYERCATPGCPNVMHVTCLKQLHENASSPTTVRNYLECTIVNPSNKISNSDISSTNYGRQCRSCQFYNRKIFYSMHNNQSILKPDQVVGHYADPFIVP